MDPPAGHRISMGCALYGEVRGAFQSRVQRAAKILAGDVQPDSVVFREGDNSTVGQSYTLITPGLVTIDYLYKD